MFKTSSIAIRCGKSYPINAQRRMFVTVSASEKPEASTTRRETLVALTAGVGALLTPLPSPAAERGLGQYIKRKRSDALETYIPPLIAARLQLEQAISIMNEQPDTARQLLRKGALDGIRDNVRVVGEYAVTTGGKPDAEVTAIVKGFFSALEKYDRVLLLASRNEKDRKLPDDAKDLGEAAVAALQKVLTLVPEEMVAQAQRVIDAILREEAEEAAESGTAMAGPAGGKTDGLQGLMPGAN